MAKKKTLSQLQTEMRGEHAVQADQREAKRAKKAAKKAEKEAQIEDEETAAEAADGE